jgi:hypothetical protein
MSYLQLPEGISSFSKAVISLWFRVPKASLDKARTQGLETVDFESDFNSYFPAFLATIPLVSFGSIEAATTGYGDGTGAHPTSPSFIGVNCSPYGTPSDKNSLAVHLAMPNTMTFQMTPMDSDGGESPEPQFLHSLQRPDAFYMSGKGDLPYHGGQLSVLDVTADTWHHALISFDLTLPAVMRYSTALQSAPPFAPSTIMLPGGPTFMWAFDDEDKTDYSLSPSCAEVYHAQPPSSVVIPPSPLPLKQITTNNLVSIAGGAWAFIGTWNPTPIKSSGNPLGIPTSAAFVDNVYKVEMAEFQMWTGVILDTSVVKNRRAFIDFERDSDGRPIEDKDGAKTLKPVDPEKAEKLLGKKPDVMLHGVNNWQNGKNTGTTGIDTVTGNPIPAGQFALTGWIKRYVPDPSLTVPAPVP